MGESNQPNEVVAEDAKNFESLESEIKTLKESLAKTTAERDEANKIILNMNGKQKVDEPTEFEKVFMHKGA